ncbi:MAG: OmpA family protein [Burkholderiaceae bacterium]|nr:OmpA family protein [Burkholderiaceae bacterium]
MLKPVEKQHDQAVIKRAGRKAHDEAHGGAWKVAFADFCLALLSLFLVLWLMAAREQQAMREVMKQASSRQSEGLGVGITTEPKGGPRGSLIDTNPIHNKNEDSPTPTPAKPVKYESASDLAELSRALTKMSVEAGLTSNLQALVTPQGLRVMLHDTDREGMFVRGSSIPTEKFRHLLRKMGPLFAQMENQMLIVGHTDSTRYARTGYSGYSNWDLSSDRAMSARSQLLAGGMHQESVLQVVGMADRAPLDTEQAAAGLNRRIELLIMTQAQSASISAMFGTAGTSEALTEDIDTRLPDPASLKRLRDQLLPKGGRAPAEPAEPAPTPAAPVK